MSFNGFKTFCEELLASIFHFLLEVLMAPMAGASPVALAAAVTDGGGHAWRCLERGFETCSKEFLVCVRWDGCLWCPRYVSFGHC